MNDPIQLSPDDLFELRRLKERLQGEERRALDSAHANARHHGHLSYMALFRVNDDLRDVQHGIAVLEKVIRQF